MVTKSTIEPDEHAIMALQPFRKGADVHDTNRLMYSYRLHCAFGNIGEAGEAAWTIYRRARQLTRRHGRA
jgi:hypothetical protein